MENEGTQYNAVYRFQIHRQIGREGTQLAQGSGTQPEGQVGAQNGQQQGPKPIGR